MAATNEISSYLKAVKGEETVTLHVNGQGLKFLGASVEASVEPGYDEKAPITFVPPKKGTLGLIAVSAKFSDIYFPFFLKIGWKDEKPHIYAQDKDEPWIPPRGKLAQITSKGKALSVKIDGEWYVTSSYGAKGNIVSVSAGNLICRYLVSEGKESEKLAEEIKKEAEEIRKMEVARGEELSEKAKIVELEKKVHGLEAEITRKEGYIELTNIRIADLIDNFRRVESEIENAESEIKNKDKMILEITNLVEKSGFGNLARTIQKINNLVDEYEYKKA